MEEKKLKCKMSTFKTELSFNEWVEKYNVSSDYIEPTKYYQGNAGSVRISMDTKMEFITSKKSSADQKSNLFGKLMSLISF